MEQGWNLSHEDLVAAGITLICGILFILLYHAKADKDAVTAFLAS